MNEKCQVFTPKNYVRELLDSVGYVRSLYGKKILENSCGDGNILLQVVQRYIDDCRLNGFAEIQIKNGLEQDIYGIEIDKENYKKCINNLDKVLQKNGIGKVKWRVTNTNYLKWNTKVRFQYIVGNPPYITYRELKKEERIFVKNNFSTCAKGKFDYCYAFIEKSINLLTTCGKMSYLIPSSIYKTVFGYNLRNFIKPYITCINDYTQIKIFDKVLVKSSIMVIDKQRQEAFLHYNDMSVGTEYDIPIDELGEKWIFSKRAEIGQRRFGEFFKVSHVVATLLNKAYVLADGSYKEVKNGYVCGKHIIEKDVVRDAKTPKTERYNRHEKIIFPYTYNINGLVRFTTGEFERLYPGAAAYLNEYREELGKRKSDNKVKWYEYGRSQALIGLNKQKLLISTVITNEVDVYKLNQECIPYAGMYIVKKENDNEYKLSDAFRILKSEQFREYVFKVGIPISGKSVRITSKDIENYMF